MNKSTLYIGLNDRVTKRQEISTLEAVKVIQNIVLEKTSGLTIYEADGIYKHDDGQIVIEKSLKVEIYDTLESVVLKIIGLLKSALNQESIILQKETVDSVFV